MKTEMEKKIKSKLEEEQYVGTDESITLEYIRMCAMGTDNDVALAQEVRRVLRVDGSRRYNEKINGHNYYYLPAENKL